MSSHPQTQGWPLRAHPGAQEEGTGLISDVCRGREGQHSHQQKFPQLAKRLPRVTCSQGWRNPTETRLNDLLQWRAHHSTRNPPFLDPGHLCSLKYPHWTERCHCDLPSSGHEAILSPESCCEALPTSVLFLQHLSVWLPYCTAWNWAAASLSMKLLPHSNSQDGLILLLGLGVN